jgi:hypothetical protein
VVGEDASGGTTELAMGRAGPTIAAVLFSALSAATAVAEPEALRGDRFITVMADNTLTGEIADGVRYDMYFLPGGQVTYRDAAGGDDRGRWRLDDAGDVCITWSGSDQEDCFRVTLDGDAVSWEGKSGSGRGRLRGGITGGTLEAGSG